VLVTLGEEKTTLIATTYVPLAGTRHHTFAAEPQRQDGAAHIEQRCRQPDATSGSCFSRLGERAREG
jgi:hypothetical protein